ncbi:hypothetical protein [Ileibacterium valens]|uniref:hypothetical protein n=1 Tax=Ileibacterium valens TaxID=1862668 RepID=UPI0025B767E8|nr:hypothetical protein [Ileibacterium valens]
MQSLRRVTTLISNQKNRQTKKKIRNLKKQTDKEENPQSEETENTDTDDETKIAMSLS